MDWVTIEQRWTDEQLAVYVEGLSKRRQREHERRAQELVAVLRALGADVSEPVERSDDIAGWVSQLGGLVEEG